MRCHGSTSDHQCGHRTPSGNHLGAFSLFAVWAQVQFKYKHSLYAEMAHHSDTNMLCWSQLTTMAQCQVHRYIAIANSDTPPTHTHNFWLGHYMYWSVANSLPSQTSCSPHWRGHSHSPFVSSSLCSPTDSNAATGEISEENGTSLVLIKLKPSPGA